MGKLIVEPLIGAVHRTSPTATAFPWRDGWMIYQFQSRVQPGAPLTTGGTSGYAAGATRATPARWLASATAAATAGTSFLLNTDGTT